MSFPRYPAYKDSGVAGLGVVPGHWKAVPLKAVSTHNDDVLDESTAPDAEIAYVDISSVDGINGIKTKVDMLFAAAPSRARRRVKHGDVIVSTVRTYLKAIARIRDPEENLIVSTGFAVIRPRGEMAPDFLGHLVSAGFFVDQVIARSTGVSYPAINASELVAIPVPVPPIPEQTQIAAFLDRETAKIDELVAEQRRLMDLLKEKRQAVISHAVTRGLNPEAPMKPSGIEWLGDVPEHWEMMSLRRCLIEHRQGYYSEDPYVDSGVKLLRITDLRDFGTIDVTQCPQVESLSDLVPFLLRSDDFVFARTGGAGTFGLVETINEPVAYASYLIRFRFDNSTHANYLRYFFLSTCFEIAVRQNIHGGVNKNIHAENIKDQYIALPPIPEQVEISEFLSLESAKFDTLTAEAQRAIDLLQERRTALISAAVTGQIDVRGEIVCRAPDAALA